MSSDTAVQSPALPSAPSFERRALNRVTFGARVGDVAHVQEIGWKTWVEQQLNPPAADDPALAALLESQLMYIKYPGVAPTQLIIGWPPVDQFRALTYLTQNVEQLWYVPRNIETKVAADEFDRIQKELNAVTWIRNAHSTFQIREFAADFWNNHFNIGRQADVFATAALPIYDAQVIRPRAFGNFQDLLAAVTTSAAMLKYLNNADSTAAHPNENFAREILELHTLGRPAYLGVKVKARGRGIAVGRFEGVALGFGDDDIIQASRALSGWTVEQGQEGPNGALPFTGKFVFNPVQHNSNAGMFMGVDLSRLSGEAQGRVVLEIIAHHPATAEFIAQKLVRRIFGDTPPATAVARAKAAWLAGRDQPDQIRRVLAAVLIDGNEIGAPGTKQRRPYERVIAFLRTTDTLMSAFSQADLAVAPLGDGIYVWPTPDGRPDTDAQWLTTMANLYSWNLLSVMLEKPEFHTNLTAQTPDDARTSARALVEHWVGRMVGYGLRTTGMDALIADAAAPYGALAAFATNDRDKIEPSLRRLVALIAASPEFGWR